MYFFQNQLSKMTVTMMVVVFSVFSTTLMAQEYKYMGTEPNITHEELLQKAAQTDFSQQAFQEIYADSKNTYYALSTENIASRYVKIRILELIATDKALVNIGGSPDSKYNLFLVNNSLGKTTDQLAKVVDEYIMKSQNEANQMSEEQLQLWLRDNDKYAKKK